MSDFRRRLERDFARHREGGGEAVPSAPSIDLSCGDFSLGIVGESFHQDVLGPLRRRQKGRDFRVVVRPEPENPYDANAVAIDLETGETIGHLSRADAERYQPALIRLSSGGRRVTCMAHTYGGGEDRPTIGVWIDLDLSRLLAGLGR